MNHEHKILKYQEKPPLLTLFAKGWVGDIRSHEQKNIAQLRVVTPEQVSQMDETSALISQLCAWRNINSNYFLDPRQVTPSSTLQWLLSLVESPERLFFIAYDNQDQPLAQYGLRKLDEHTVELDNGILGVRGEHQDLFFRLQLLILSLCRTKLGFQEVRARVIADNIPALFLHKRSGLRKIQILKHQAPNGKDILVVGASLQEIKHI